MLHLRQRSTSMCLLGKKKKKYLMTTDNLDRRASVITALAPFAKKPREPVCDASISRDAECWKARGLVRGEDELSFQKRCSTWPAKILGCFGNIRSNSDPV